MLPREPIETLLRFRDWLTDLATPRCIAPSENVYYQGPQTGQNLCPQNSTSLQLSAVFLLPFTPDVLYPVHLKQLSSPRRMGPSIPCLFCVPSFPRPFPSFSTRLTWLALEHLRRPRNIPEASGCADCSHWAETHHSGYCTEIHLLLSPTQAVSSWGHGLS